MRQKYKMIRICMLVLIALALSSFTYAFTVEGTITDASNSSLYINNATVKLYNDNTDALIAEDTTDASGYYVIVDASCAVPITYRLEYSAVNYSSKNDTITLMPFPPGACGLTVTRDQDLVKVRMPEGYITGTVRDSFTMLGLDKTDIALSITGMTIQEKTTSKIGTYNFTVSPDNYDAEYTRDRYFTQEKNISVIDNQTTTQDVDLIEIPRLGGLVKDDSGNAVGGAIVSAYELDIVNTTYSNETRTSSYKTGEAVDYSGAVFDNTVLNSSEGYIELNSSFTQGNLTSASYKAESIPAYDSIDWDSFTPGNSSIKFQIATNTDNSTWNFKGPDGTNNSYYESPATIPQLHDNDPYMRYKAYFETDNTNYVPVLNNVTISYTYESQVAHHTYNETLLNYTAITGQGGEFVVITSISLIKLVAEKSGYSSNSVILNATGGENTGTIIVIESLDEQEEPPSASGGGGGGAYVGCLPEWNCTEWSICYPDGTKTRTCIDLNECPDPARIPAEIASCVYGPYVEEPGEKLPRKESPLVYGYIPEIEEGVEDFNVTLFEDMIYGFRFEKEDHQLIVYDIESNNAKMLFYSEPKNITLFIEQTQSIDLDDDGTYDYVISLLITTDNSIILNFEKITFWDLFFEWISEKGYVVKYLFIAIFLVIFLILLERLTRGLFVISRKKKMARYEYFEKQLKLKEQTYKDKKDIESRIELLNIQASRIKFKAKRDKLLAKIRNKNNMLKLMSDKIKIDHEKKKQLLDVEMRQKELAYEKQKRMKLKDVQKKKADITLDKKELSIDDTKQRRLLDLERAKRKLEKEKDMGQHKFKYDMEKARIDAEIEELKRRKKKMLGLFKNKKSEDMLLEPKKERNKDVKKVISKRKTRKVKNKKEKPLKTRSKRKTNNKNAKKRKTSRKKKESKEKKIIDKVDNILNKGDL